MISGLGKRIVSLVVLGFAVMGFVAVPIFEKTAYEYVLDAWQSDEAKEATHEVVEKIDALKTEFDGRPAD